MTRSASLPLRMALIGLAASVLIVVPGLIAERSLMTVREENERAGFSAAALREYLKLGRVSDAGLALVRSGQVKDEASRRKVLDMIEAQIRRIDRATAAEQEIIRKGPFTPERAATMRREEQGQRDRTAKLRTMKAQVLTGFFEDAWWQEMQHGVESEEEEVRGAHLRAVAALEQTQLAFFATSLVLVLAAIVIALWARGNIVEPLQRLLNSTHRVARNDFSVDLPDKGPREFRALNRAFNTMAAQLGRSQARLESANRRLEDEVRARTADLLAANASLRELDDRRRGFIATAGHELRTPVAVLRTDAEVALRDGKPTVEGLLASLERVVRTAGTLGRLIEDMLRVARADAPVLSYERETIDLGTLVMGALDDFRPVIEADGGVVSVAGLDQVLVVRVDPLRIQQVLRIVLDNAVTHGGDELGVHVELSRDDGFASVRIADRGEGIDPARLPDLLDRSQWPRRRSEDGHGLGLTIAATIMEAHDGTIAIASAPGSGVVVTLRLPCERSPLAGAREEGGGAKMLAWAGNDSGAGNETGAGNGAGTGRSRTTQEG